MFVAWRDLKHAKGRFALMGAVIILITLLVGLLSGLTGGLSRQNVSAITDLPADQVAFQAPTSGQKISYSDSVVTEQQWREWSRVPGVAHAEPLGITTTKAAAGNRTGAVTAFGVEPDSRLAPSGDRITDHTVVLSGAAADDLSAQVGDVVDIAGQRLSVSSIAGDAYFSHTPVVWTSIGSWQHIAPPTGGSGGESATVVALTTDSDVDLATANETIGTTTERPGDSLSAIGSYTSENGSLQLMRGLLFAISALVIGAFFTVWTVQRSGDIAILKALGASTANLLRDALGQALVLLVGGTVIGTGIAVGAGALVGGAIPFELTLGTFLLPAAVMIVIGMLGAAAAIYRITTVDPLTALGSAR